MITKAIVDWVYSPYSIRVRIPIYHKAEGVAGATPSNNLPTASVCSQPGQTGNLYKKGDVVYVEFEEDTIADPIIMGLLYRKEN